MEIQVQVLKFFSGKTTTGRDKWDVYFSDGTKATAWEYAVAAKAQQAFQTGATITARIVEKPNPRGGNPYRNLEEVSEATGAPLNPPQAQTLQAPQNGTASRQNGSQSLSGGSMTPEDKIRVTKLSCISSAAAIFSGSGDVDLTLEAATKIFNAVMQKPQEQPAVAAEPQAVAAFVAEQAGAPVVQVGVAEEPKPLPWAVA